MRNLSIGQRLLIGFLTVLLLALAIAGVGLWRLQAASSATRAMMDEPLRKERLVGDWYRLIHTSVRRTTAIAKSSDPSLATYFAPETAASTKALSGVQDEVEKLLRSAEEKALLDGVVEARKRYIKTREVVSGHQKEGRSEEANRVFDAEFAPASKVYLDRLQELLEHQRKAIDSSAEQVNATNDSGRHWLIALGAAALLLGVASALVITRSITRPLHRAMEVAGRVADGDLTGQIECSTRDETGRLLEMLSRMQGRLAQLLTLVRSNADEVASAAEHISHGTSDLSSRTEQQAGALQQTSSTMEQLSGNVRSNADSAQRASHLARSASEVAERGGQVVGDVVRTMEGINHSSKRISDIIGVIDGIAFQTNILALNAAVEAARAGESGRGFAVVASEVRNLAHRSAEAAKEIKQLILGSVEQVETGSALVDQAGLTMREVVDSVRAVSELVNAISLASAEQSTGVSQVGQAVSHMDQATQQNAALVEESAAAAESLMMRARQLAEASAKFKLPATV